jgi:hypothetical protein
LVNRVVILTPMNEVIGEGPAGNLLRFFYSS